MQNIAGWSINVNKISFLKHHISFYLISWIWLHPLWVLHLIHCFLDCVSLLMSTQIEMINVTLMYI